MDETTLCAEVWSEQQKQAALDEEFFAALPATRLQLAKKFPDLDMGALLRSYIKLGKVTKAGIKRGCVYSEVK